MIVPGQIQRQYDLLQPHVKAVTGQVRETVLAYCERNGFAYTGRTKTVESLAEKIESGRFRSISEIDDWFACAIVIPTLHDEATVEQFLREQFRVSEIKPRGNTWKAPDVFRFEATRVIAQLRFHDGEQPEIRNDIRFEVQIRSAFEHAWSSATHNLVYKADTHEWRRLRLAAQLKASVEQLDQLLMTFDSSAAVIGESRWNAVEWKQKIIEVFKELETNGSIPSEVVPKDWSRFAENVTQALQASYCWPRQRTSQSDFIDGSIEVVREEIAGMAAQDKFPRSLSLLQTVFAVLWSSGQITAPLRRYAAPLTSEVDDVFPSIKGCIDRVDVAWL